MNVLISGMGQMGQKIRPLAEARGDQVLALVDAMHLDLLQGLEAADVLIDFSHRNNLSWIADYVRENECPLVCGTTGLTEEDLTLLHELSEEVPVFYSSNYSYGVAVLLKLLETAVPLLSESFDMELTETHHRKKQDAPSGTAKSILQILNQSGAFEEVYGRHGQVGARKTEIGVHSLRGGTEAGEHTVYFFGDNESITISHRATDRGIFASGALRAADFIYCTAPGFYGMKDLI